MMREIIIYPADLRVQFQGKLCGKEIKTKWQQISEASNFLKKHANLRELFGDEVVFDIDGGNAAESAIIAKKLLAWLKVLGITATCWWNGNRSQHIHFLFDEMLEMTYDQRKKCRLWWIRQANKFLDKDVVDESKKVGMISLEYSNHFKGSGRQKILSGSVKSDAPNKLPVECFEHINKKIEYDNIKTSQPISKAELESHPLIKYIRAHKIQKSGNRHRVLSPNIAALMLQSKLSDSEAEAFATSLNASFLDCNKSASSDILEWFVYFKQQGIQQ